MLPMLCTPTDNRGGPMREFFVRTQSNTHVSFCLHAGEGVPARQGGRPMDGWYSVDDYAAHYRDARSDAVWAWWLAPLANYMPSGLGDFDGGAALAVDYDLST